ncbi:MAG: hypothetical protein KGL31_07220 [candidate division NC10 bacterium]|nr:hypothetical protein [candidate division NC10 bacterium]MDE2321692.1 hypothetical protein [candidate division NC10 bacterium]
MLRPLARVCGQCGEDVRGVASVLVGPAGRVVAFEPFPRNLAYLRKHLALNHVRNTVVMEGAVYDDEGEIRLLAGLGYTLRPEVGDNLELCSEVVGR